MVGALIAGALASGLIGLAGAGINMAYNSAEADKARAFEAEQADKNRAYSSAEASAERAWQEKMQNSYYQRTAADMEAAGLNKYAMYGSFSGGSSAMSGASASAPGIASGNAASYSGNALSGLQDMIKTSFMLNALKKTPGGETALKEVVKTMQFNAHGNALGSTIKRTYTAR